MTRALPAPSASPSAPSELSGRRLIFVVTEDWFFASHFLPMVRAARELGLAVAVVTRVRDHRAAIEGAGARVIPFEAERRSLNPVAAGNAAGRLASVLRREKPDLVHCIALRSILLGGTAALMAGVARRVYALTGLGFFGAEGRGPGRLVRPALQAGLRALVRGPLDGAQTRFLFENPDDVRLLGFAPADPRVAVLGGAGVDPDAFTPAAPPPASPLKVAVAARMVWSKGIDLAVEATRAARRRGAPVELSLFGAPDPSNPRAIPAAILEGWSGEAGIDWHGRTQDVAAIWRAHHVACLPSRGGEGLPRTLLEAAACGRALLTTDVPGCRTFVRDGIEGLVVAPNDVGALADALVRLAADPALVARFGIAARARVLDGFTERHVRESVKTLYAGLLAG